MRSKTTRSISRYDPFADAARHAGWRIVQTNLHGIGEVFDVNAGVILLDSKHDPRAGWAHAVAHLDLGHTIGCEAGSFTEEQERQADFLAGVRLDKEGSRDECA